MNWQTRRLAAQWYSAALTEHERYDLVGKFSGTVRYGSTVSYDLLPEHVRQIVYQEWLRRTEGSESA